MAKTKLAVNKQQLLKTYRRAQADVKNCFIDPEDRKAGLQALGMFWAEIRKEIDRANSTGD